MVRVLYLTGQRFHLHFLKTYRRHINGAAFIGPRPELPARAKVYADAIPYYNTRHFIKPGLSGWAQINDYNAPRGEVDIDLTKNKLSYDLYYLKHRSLFLDMQIALKTIATLLMRTGS